ncbi:MAG: hypothetical protein HFI68_02600 [Lachnospiraceae bacterium]|nr:hypothetical protein [Lachnospiraceae bacterium]
MRKKAILFIYTAIMVFFIAGCGKDEKKPSVSFESGKETREEAKDRKETVPSQPEMKTAVSTDGSTENIDEETVAGNVPISPAATPAEVLALIDRAFTDHDFDYLRAAGIEPYVQEYMKFILSGAPEEEYWAEYDDMQGSYYDVGLFESYTSEITDETRIEDLKGLEAYLLSEYNFSCTVQDAYEITYNRIVAGTEGSSTNEGYQAKIIQVDGFWYICSS